MVVAIGSDHVGFAMKAMIRKHLEERGYTVIDKGTFSPESCDYPIYASAVAHSILSGESERGVLICGTGVGISMAANKVHGIRAAVCSEPYSAALTRRHNDAHIIAFGARVVGEDVAKQIVDAFFDAEFEGGRHQRRVDMMMALEDKP